MLTIGLCVGLYFVVASACSNRTPADQTGSAGSQSPKSRTAAPPAGSAAPPLPGDGSAAPPTSAGGSASPPAKQAPPELVTGGISGLDVIDTDGKVIRQLSNTPTSHPRWTADHQALVFLAESGELRRLELGSGAETVISKLPATLTPCPGKTIDPTHLRIQSDDDFAFERGGRAICIRLQDRNINMADVIVTFSVDLATGKATPTIVMSECNRGSGSMPEGCSGTLPDRTPRQDDAPRAFTISDGVLRHGKSRRKLGRPRDYHEEGGSPSGKWAIVGGNLMEGDYISRDLFLLDRDTGKLYPLPETATIWPRAIPERDLGKLQSWSERTVAAVGETPIFWLGPGDAVVIGQHLVVPGVRIAHFEGDLAR